MSDVAPLRPEFDFISSCLRAGCALDGVPAQQSIEANQYLEMEGSFRSKGGMAACELVTELLRGRTDQPISMLARWIVEREVLSVSWRSCLMLPMFQFDFPSMAPRPPVREVIRELGPVLGDWPLTLWFAKRNALLGGVAPVDAIDSNPAAVLGAAHAQHLVLLTQASSPS